jgi:hypothetical protein
MLQGYGFTKSFEEEVLRKRPYLTRELCIRVAQQTIHNAFLDRRFKL